MALEQISGMNKWPFMKSRGALVLEKARDEIKRASCNMANPLTLMAPPFDRPEETLKHLAAIGKVDMDFHHGTTTLAFIYQGGIVMCVDSRATAGGYIGSHGMKKVVPISDYMLSTIAGGAADCTYWDRVLTREVRLYELRHKQRMSVRSAARFLGNIGYQYRGMGLSMNIILAGWTDDGPSLAYVDSNGLSVVGKLFAAGSGSKCALGLLDSEHRYEMSDEEAYDLAFRAIYHSSSRDSYTGGVVNCYHLNKKKWKLVASKDSEELREALGSPSNTGTDTTDTIYNFGKRYAGMDDDEQVSPRPKRRRTD
ncbi:proteasome subunit beta type-5 [Drosophila bipectinata]|uniref:proteasome subunit beta type-5 n=1 Tax=Drosophila bipectinata TaxID=42026 RepID=UPI001C8AF009|nr:proteasome subunit beta type-5 [Drosophila bipectinata]